MNKFEKMSAFIDTKVTPEFISDEVTKVVVDLVKGEFPPNATVTLSWTVKDILEVRGFYVVDGIVQELIAAFMGRFMRLVAIEKFNIKLTPISAEKLFDIAMSTNEKELVAIPMVIQQLRQKIGEPIEIDTEKAEILIAQRDNNVAQMMGMKSN